MQNALQKLMFLDRNIKVNIWGIDKRVLNVSLNKTFMDGIDVRSIFESEPC